MDSVSPGYAQGLGGGSLLIAWQLRRKRVLIVGGGEVASQRIESILVTDAHITVLCPAAGLNKRSKHLIELHPDRIAYFDASFSGPGDIEGFHMVLTAIDEPARSAEIVEICRANKIPVNAADIPDLCDFYFGSQIRDGPLQIMISTNGNGPRFAALIKKRLQNGLTGREGEAIKKVGELRVMLKERAPGIGGSLGKKRMKWMSAVCEKWELEDFILLDRDAMKKLLDIGWDVDQVPTLEQVVGRRSELSRSSKSYSHRRGPSLPAIALFSASTFVIGAIIGFSLCAHRLSGLTSRTNN